MNEIDMNETARVRRLLGEPPPPSAEASARALARLEDAMAPGGGRVRPSRTGRRRFGRPVWLGAGLLAAGTAAAVAVAVTGQGSPGSPPGTPPGTVDLDKQAVLVAADRAAEQPTGNYWSTERLSGQAYVVRAETGTYAIFGAHSEMFHWAGARKGMGEAYYDRDLPARPQTPRDEALWRRAGSPSAIRVWSGDHYATYTTRATGWRSEGPEVGVDPKGGGRFYGMGRGGASLGDLRNLPTAPAELADQLLSPAEMERAVNPKASGGRKLKEGVVPRMQMRRTSALLSAPVSSKVRSGLIKALAAQPGIRAIGRVTDPLGRRGVALATSDRTSTETGEFGTPKAQQGTYASRDVIIFDERTGALLALVDQLTKPGGPYAEMKPGFVISYEADRSPRWTDTRPKPPAELPF
ncbi:CU044_5270 family protein [Actinomadura sp. WMMA1423]|uniref:CU044_5270 family protein n=1 Tax=Actinomadura sp. WMMA1423 TaxID=2591108 RepID=UPI001146C630|nr:CU044_5270 family protein [Actinomadura sp. WMMA1423]